jgi:hypothetical protein
VQATRSKVKSNGNRLTVMAATALAVAIVAPGPASAAVDVSHFSVSPSTAAAGGHPNLSVSIQFGEQSSGLKDVAFHLPAGLTANPRAIPFCSRRLLLADLCASRSRAGTITVVGIAYGLELAVTRRIYNVRPAPAERVRLGVPIFGSLSRPGLAAELPLTERPLDTGLDMAIRGLPQNVGGVAVRLKEVSFTLKGVSRTRVKRKLRTKPFLTNPAVCLPATFVLEMTSYDAPGTAITRSSGFTPTGCSASATR